MNTNFVNGSNFATYSDVIYSQIIETVKFENQMIENCVILDKNDKYVFYKLSKFSIKTNDIIFCNALLLENLFKDLSQLKNVSNLKLITSQSDRLITKKACKNLPDSISEYYAVNLSTDQPKLKSLPLGIANNYSSKNLLSEDFEFPFPKNELKEQKLYLNFNELTNIKHRKNLKEHFIKFDWAVVRKEINLIEEYKNDLRNFKYILCPWGNGIDTHRIWEALYLGSTPVIKWHKTFECLKDLPVIFFNNYDEINLEFLEKNFNSLNHLNDQQNYLDIRNWINQIKLSKYSDIKEEIIYSNEYYLKKFFFKRKIKTKFNRIFKKIRFRLFQISKKFK